MQYNSNDISAYFQHCPECDIQWRSHHKQPCRICTGTTGVVLILNDIQEDVLMEAVITKSFGVNSEDDILVVLSEMMIKKWPDVPTALLAQACWMHLRKSPSTEEIEVGMEFFEKRFQESLQEFLDEYMWD